MLFRSREAFHCVVQKEISYHMSGETATHISNLCLSRDEVAGGGLRSNSVGPLLCLGMR